MLYTLKQGPIEKKILTQCLRERLPIPEAIKNAPELALGLELYFDGFWELDTCRSRGLDDGIISWFAIRKYCKTLELDEDQTDKMHVVIPLMDQEYLKFRREKKSTKQKGK